MSYAIFLSKILLVILPPTRKSYENVYSKHRWVDDGWMMLQKVNEDMVEGWCGLCVGKCGILFLGKWVLLRPSSTPRQRIICCCDCGWCFGKLFWRIRFGECIMAIKIFDAWQVRTADYMAEINVDLWFARIYFAPRKWMFACVWKLKCSCGLAAITVKERPAGAST